MYYLLDAVGDSTLGEYCYSIKSIPDYLYIEEEFDVVNDSVDLGDIVSLPNDGGVSSVRGGCGEYIRVKDRRDGDGLMVPMWYLVNGGVRLINAEDEKVTVRWVKPMSKYGYDDEVGWPKPAIEFAINKLISTYIGTLSDEQSEGV